MNGGHEAEAVQPRALQAMLFLDFAPSWTSGSAACSPTPPPHGGAIDILRTARGVAGEGEMK